MNTLRIKKKKKTTQILSILTEMQTRVQGEISGRDES